MKGYSTRKEELRNTELGRWGGHTWLYTERNSPVILGLRESLSGSNRRHHATFRRENNGRQGADDRALATRGEGRRA